MSGFDQLAGWSDILDTFRKPAKKVLGKSIFNATSKAINTYGLTAASVVATVATGGAAAPTIGLALAAEGAKAYAERKAKDEAEKAAKKVKTIQQAAAQAVAELQESPLAPDPTAPAPVALTPTTVVAGTVALVGVGAFLVSRFTSR